MSVPAKGHAHDDPDAESARLSMWRLHEGVSGASRAVDVAELYRLQKSSTKPRHDGERGGGEAWSRFPWRRRLPGRAQAWAGAGGGGRPAAVSGGCVAAPAARGGALGGAWAPGGPARARPGPVATRPSPSPPFFPPDSTHQRHLESISTTLKSKARE